MASPLEGGSDRSEVFETSLDRGANENLNQEDSQENDKEQENVGLVVEGIQLDALPVKLKILSILINPR